MTENPHVSGDLVARVRNGEVPQSEELLSFLSVADRTVRAQRLFALSEAYFEGGNTEQAVRLVQRAIAVSGYDRRYLESCVALQSRIGDIDGVRETLKRVGVNAAKECRVLEALDLFNRSLYAYSTHCKQDRYVYDFEMLSAIEAMALHFRNSAPPSEVGGGRIRIAILVFGTLHVGSVLLKILAMFAEHADRSRFELAFFVPEVWHAVLRSKSARKQLRPFRRAGWTVHVPRTVDPLKALLETANAITRWSPDALLTSALCADLRHYFIASMRPAPQTIALVQGPPAQFTAPWVDWNIAVSAHPGMDTPGNCSLVPLEFPLPDRKSIELVVREQYGLAPENKVIVSGGRPGKFESADHWRVVGEILARRPEAVYLAIGLSELPQVALTCLPRDLVAHVRSVEWRDDYLRVLGLADVVLDTYPSGGGVVLLDAMALGIPVVSMANDYLHEFDQTDWGLGNEFVPISELVAPRHDHARLVEIIDKLLADAIYRGRMGRECEALVRAQRGSPARMISRWEEVLSKVIVRSQSTESMEPKPTLASSKGAVLGRLLHWFGRSEGASR